MMMATDYSVASVEAPALYLALVLKSKSKLCETKLRFGVGGRGIQKSRP